MTVPAESFKDSIVGIIVLGALGSLFAAPLLKLTAYLLRRFITSYLSAINNTLVRHRYISGFMTGFLSGNAPVIYHFIYFSYRTVKVTLCCTMLCLWLGVFMYLQYHNWGDFAWSAYIALVISFVFGWIVIKEFAVFWINYTNIVHPYYLQACKEYDKRVQGKQQTGKQTSRKRKRRRRGSGGANGEV